MQSVGILWQIPNPAAPNPRLACCVQFYLGTTRLQLEHKGGPDHIVTSIANVVPAFGFIGIPVIGWLLDRMGYGITLATINFLGVLASFFQAMPSVWFQVCTGFVCICMLICGLKTCRLKLCRQPRIVHG